jgi:hypothetical protein
MTQAKMERKIKGELVLMAGVIVGQICTLTEEKWLELSQTAELSQEYRDAIAILAETRARLESVRLLMEAKGIAVGRG